MSAVAKMLRVLKTPSKTVKGKSTAKRTKVVKKKVAKVVKDKSDAGIATVPKETGGTADDSSDDAPKGGKHAEETVDLLKALPKSVLKYADAAWLKTLRSRVSSTSAASLEVQDTPDSDADESTMPDTIKPKRKVRKVIKVPKE